MDWANERYIRTFTRDTIHFLSLSFEAQGLQGLLFRKCDRAGVIPLGGLGKRGLAVIIGQVHRWPELERFVDELLAVGTFVIKGDKAIAPNFLEAQETPVSDAERQRRKRERERDKALAGDLLAVTPDVQHVVTPSGHAGPSRPGVTSSPHDLASHTSQPIKETLSSSPQETAAPLDLVVEVASQTKRSKEVHALFDYWKLKTNRSRAVLNPKRRRLLEQALRDFGFDVAKLAIDGCLLSPFHQGENDRKAIYDDITLIFRDAQHVEDFSERAENAQQREAREKRKRAAFAGIGQRDFRTPGQMLGRRVESGALPAVRNGSPAAPGQVPIHHPDADEGAAGDTSGAGAGGAQGSEKTVRR